MNYQIIVLMDSLVFGQLTSTGWAVFRISDGYAYLSAPSRWCA